jgi:hypothetical protein
VDRGPTGESRYSGSPRDKCLDEVGSYEPVGPCDQDFPTLPIESLQWQVPLSFASAMALAANGLGPGVIVSTIG